MTISEQLTREYLEKYPTTSKLAIARLLFRDHPLIFNSVENARTRVRYYTHKAPSLTVGSRVAYCLDLSAMV